MSPKGANAYKLLKAGIKAEGRGLVSKALNLYRRSSAPAPRARSPRCREAMLLFDQGRWKDAIQATRALLRRWPEEDWAYFMVGECSTELDRYRRAETAFRQSLAINPKPERWVFLSSVLLNLARRAESEECLWQALKLDSNYEETHFNLGLMYGLRRQYAKAEKRLRRAIEIDPKYAAAYAQLGWMIKRRKTNVKEAVTLLNKSIRQDPNYGWSRVYLANTLWTLNRIKAADGQYRKLLEIWPKESISYWCYGSFLASERIDDRLAEQYLRKAVKLDPKDQESYYNLGKYLQRWNRRKEATKFLKKAVALGSELAAKLL